MVQRPGVGMCIRIRKPDRVALAPHADRIREGGSLTYVPKPERVGDGPGIVAFFF